MATRLFPFFRREAARESEERRLLLDSVSETRRLLNQAYAGFNRTGDPDLIESYVYEINALQSRHAYLLRQIRALEEADPAQAQVEPQAEVPAEAG